MTVVFFTEVGVLIISTGFKTKGSTLIVFIISTSSFITNLRLCLLIKTSLTFLCVPWTRAASKRVVMCNWLVTEVVPPAHVTWTQHTTIAYLLWFAHERWVKRPGAERREVGREGGIAETTTDSSVFVPCAQTWKHREPAQDTTCDGKIKLSLSQ